MGDREKTWEDRGEGFYDDLTYRPKRTVAKWAAIIGLILVALASVGGTISWIGSWGSEAKRVASPENVREQNTAIIDDWEAMDAAALNACNAKNATGAGDPTLVEDPAFAYKAQYLRIRIDYNRRMANLYEAQAVRNLPLPSNLRSYPKRAATLQDKMAEVC